MCATARSSASPPQRVKARWPSPSFTDTWKKLHDPVRKQTRLWRGSTVLESLMSADVQPDALQLPNTAHPGDRRRQVDHRRPLLPVDTRAPTLQRAAKADPRYFQEDVGPDSAQPRARRPSGAHRLSASAAEDGISAAGLRSQPPQAHPLAL